MLFLLGACLASIAQASIPDAVAEGYCQGRSGEVLIATDDMDSVGMTIIMPKSSYLDSSTDTREMALQNAADVILRGLGVEPVHEDYQASFVQTSLFNAASSNFLLTIQSLAREYIPNGAPKLNSLMSSPSSTVFDMQCTSYPYHPLTAFTSLTTGTAPCDHGIVGESWQSEGEVVDAFDSNAGSLTPNINDLVSRAFDGQSLTLSVAGSYAYSQANCVHQSLSNNDFCVAANMDGDFISQVSRASAALRGNAAAMLHKLGDSESVLNLIDGSSVQGTTVTLGDASFDLTEASNRAFFVELQYLSSLLREMSEPSHPLHSLVVDSVPDSLSVTFTSLTGLANTYGFSSPQYIAAVQLLDACIPHLVGAVKHMYPDSLVEIVLAGSESPTVAPSNDVLSAVSHLTDQKTAQPSLYLHPSATNQLATTCSDIKDSVTAHQVHCPALHLNQLNAKTDSQVFFLQDEADSVSADSTSSSSDEVTDADVRRYQISLWFSVSLAFVIVFAAYAIGGMSNKKDSLLYGDFNPDWAMQKQR